MLEVLWKVTIPGLLQDPSLKSFVRVSWPWCWGICGTCGWLYAVLILPSNCLLTSILLHGWLWKGLTKSSLLYRGAWTPGAGGSVTQWLCRERRALFIRLSMPSCSFSLALFLSPCSCFMAFSWREKRRKIMSVDSVVLLFPCGHKCSRWCPLPEGSNSLSSQIWSKCVPDTFASLFKSLGYFVTVDIKLAALHCGIKYTHLVQIVHVVKYRRSFRVSHAYKKCAYLAKYAYLKWYK